MTDLTSGLPRPSRRRIKVDSARRDAEFDRARRGSRRVGWLKVVLPALAVIGIGGYIAFYALMPKDIAVSLSGLSLDTKSLTIDKPRFSGFTGTAQSYEISARRAIQDLANPKLVRLEEIEGTFGISGGKGTLAAKAGVYDSAAQTLMLKDGVSVKTSKGIAVELGEATVDFTNKTLVSQAPITISAAEGAIRANGVRVGEGGKTVTFEKGVSVTYLPKTGGDNASPPEADTQ
jgi:lipopolysaccharide export system protein LptC